MTSKPTDHLDTKQVNEAAYTFKTSLNLAKSMMFHKTISQKGIARVLGALLEFPIADTPPKFKNKIEEQLFLLTISIFNAKNDMMNAVMAHHKDTEEKLNVEKKTHFCYNDLRERGEIFSTCVAFQSPSFVFPFVIKTT